MAVAKGFEVALDLLVDLGDGRIDGIDLVQMQLEQKTVMPGDAPAQGRVQFVRAEP